MCKGFFNSVSGREPTGFVKIVYFSFYPDFNSPYGSGQIFYFILWAAAGIIVIVYNVNRFRRLLKVDKRAQNIFHNYSSDADPSPPFRAFRLAAIPLVLTLTVGGYYIYKTSVPDENTWDSSYEENVLLGNTPGNTANDGVYLLLNEKIFFVNWNDNHRLYSMNLDSSGQKPLTSEAVSNLNGKDGWIYYNNKTDKGALYRIRSDGTGRMKLLPYTAGNFVIDGGVIYFSNEKDGGKLYTMKKDGTASEKLCDMSPFLINLIGEKIYFINFWDDEKIYEIKKDGIGLRKF